MNKRIKTSKFTLLIVGIIYLMLSILAIISEFNVNTNDDTIGSFSIYALLRISWWPFLILVLMLMSYILYSKKFIYAAIVESLLGGILLANILKNIILYGNSILSLIISLILPIIFIYQGIVNIIKRKDKEDIKEDKTKVKAKTKITGRKERR